MELALDEARAAAEIGEVPVGAVLVDRDGNVVARGRNRREQRSDPTAHAEIEALRDGTSYEGWRREGSTLYVTLEPCPMCMGALVNARVSRGVFGAWDHKAGAAKTGTAHFFAAGAAGNTASFHSLAATGAPAISSLTSTRIFDAVVTGGM